MTSLVKEGHIISITRNKLTENGTENGKGEKLWYKIGTEGNNMKFMFSGIYNI